MKYKKHTNGKACRIKGFLALHGLSQARAAEIMGITAPTMSLKVNGQYPFTTDELAALLTYMGGVDPEEMVRTFFPKVRIVRDEIAQ